MIALALLFIVIIGLLSVIVWLLHKYFEAYTNLYQANELQSRVVTQQKKSDILGREDIINTIINERLTELEQKFPTSHYEEERPQEEAEVLTETLKNVLTSYMNLLKVKPQDSNH